MALTVGTWTRIHIGNRHIATATVTGDGATSSINVPLGRLEYAWLQAIDDTSPPMIASLSGSTLTYSKAVPAYSHYLSVIGWD